MTAPARISSTLARRNTRNGRRSATAPRTSRPSVKLAQYADTPAAATPGETPRDSVSNAYAQIPAAASMPVYAANVATPVQTARRANVSPSEDVRVVPAAVAPAREKLRAVTPKHAASASCP